MIAAVALANILPKGIGKGLLPQPSRVGVVAQQMKVEQQKKALEEQKAAGNFKSQSIFRYKQANLPAMIAKNDAKDMRGRSLAPSKASSTTTETVGNLRVTKDSHGIVVNVTGGENRYYTRQSSGTSYAPNIMSTDVIVEPQEGDVITVWDGDVVYMRNMINLYTNASSWMKGTKEGNTITFAARQPVFFSDYYYATTSVSWGVMTDATLSPLDDMETISYTIDGNNLTLNTPEGDDKFIIGVFWDDDRIATGYCDEKTSLVLNESYDGASYQMVDLPEDAKVEEWYFNAVSHQTDGSSYPVKNTVINVAFVGNDVYVKNISTNLPEAWVKGVVSESGITFASGQYLGNDRNDLWFVGTNGVEPPVVEDVQASYDTENKVIALSNDYLVNGTHNTVYFVEWYSSVEFSAEKKSYPEPIITELTTTLPYLNTFNTEAEQDEAAIYDANDDNNTFYFNTDYDNNTTARYCYHYTHPADEYLVFPGVELKAGSTYNVSVEARCTYSNSERIEVVAGIVAKASQLNIEVIPATDVHNNEFETFSAPEFSVEEDGIYFLAVHAISDANKYYLDVNKFSIVENDYEAPALVSDLTVVADENAAKKATVSFVLPTQTRGGKILKSDLNVVVTCDGVEAYTDTKPAGSAVQCEVEVETDGMHTFAVTSNYNNHFSNEVSASVFVGEDYPSKVVNLDGVDRNDKVEITWDAPKTGTYGGPLNPNKLTFNVYPVNLIDWGSMKYPQVDKENPIVTGLKETNYTFDYETNVGEQDMTYFAVSALNDLGESETDYAYVLTGEAYKLPFHETFPNAYNIYWWERDCDDETYNTTGGAYIASYDDSFVFAYYGIENGWISGKTGKISLEGAKNPTVSFDYVSTTAAKITVIVTTPEGDTLARTFKAEETDEFIRVKMSLADFVGQPWIRLTIRGDFDESGAFSYTNVNVLDLCGVDFEATISAPESVTAGQNIEVAATVRNLAEEPNGAYVVKVYANDELVKEFEGVELPFFGFNTFTTKVPTSLFNIGETVVKVVVECADDERLANNEAAKMVDVVAPDVAPVENVDAKQVGDGVLVEWEMTKDLPVQFTEDFEKTVMFDQEVEDWTLVDADGATIGYLGSIYMPFTTASWFALDYADPSLSYYTSNNAHSGTKYMSTLYNNGGEQNDDWMISPELPGIAQTISFWARTYGTYGPETVEILYSTTDKELSSFISLDKQEVPNDLDYSTGQGVGVWYEYTYELPKGAKYFALRCISTNVYSLFVDDVNFIKFRPNPTGYNVYVDGELVGTAGADDRDFTCTDVFVGGSHKFDVTALYGDVESMPVGKEIEVSGVNSIHADSEPIEVYNLQGMRVTGKKLPAGVYIVNGEKVVKK